MVGEVPPVRASSVRHDHTPTIYFLKEGDSFRLTKCRSGGGLRRLWSGALDPELLHAAAERVGVQTQDSRGPTRSLDDPARSTQFFHAPYGGAPDPSSVQWQL